MESLGKTLEDYTRRGCEPLPDDSQCSICGFFDIQHPEAVRILKGRDPSGVQNLLIKSRCKCQNAEDVKRSRETLRHDQAALPGLEPKTFGNFKPRPGTEEMIEAAGRFARLEGPRMLVIAGNTGTGKTHLMSAIGHDVLNWGGRVRFEPAIRFVETLRSSYQDDRDDGIIDTDPRGSLRNMMSWYNNMKVLLLDDVGAERTTDFANEQINAVIDARINSGGWLAISTNLSKDEMIQHLGRRNASRIWATNPELEKKDEAKVVINTAGDYRS